MGNPDRDCLRLSMAFKWSQYTLLAQKVFYKINTIL